MDKYSVFSDAEDFTQHMTTIVTRGVVTSNELSPFAKNIVRIMNLDVEDNMYIYKTTKDDRIVIILFAKNTPIGKNNAYSTERVPYEGKDIDIIVLPNHDLLDKEITNSEILRNLDYVYSFILRTPKPSLDYVSPLEIARHLYARYYFKMKFFQNAFEMDQKTKDSLRQDIEDMGLDTVIDFEQIFDLAGDNTVSTDELFNKNKILDYIDASVYYTILDDLRDMVGENDDEEE